MRRIHKNLGEKFSKNQEEVRQKIIKARKILKDVEIPHELLEVIAQLCMDMGVDGHRADIAILKTAKTIAAYNEQIMVTEDHVNEAALLVLGERFHKASLDEDKVKKQMEQAKSELSNDKTDQESKKNSHQRVEIKKGE